jgi:hypothetical protein
VRKYRKLMQAVASILKKAHIKKYGHLNIKLWQYKYLILCMYKKDDSKININILSKLFSGLLVGTEFMKTLLM